MRPVTRNIVYSLIALLSLQIVIAQSVGIGTTNPHPSARLEVNSSSQGLLIPTLTSAQRSAIIDPATGLLVFQTNGTPGFYYYDGVNWINLTNGYMANSEGLAVSSNYGITATIAGSGMPGFADGSGTAASFNSPDGIAVDVSGNLYVGDQINNRIRKITATGVVTTLAGSGVQGSADGVGAAASFYSPGGVAVDASGNVYVVDILNHKIRKITSTGVVTTLAGSGNAGFADGIGATAVFRFPMDIALDVSGNLYVADATNNRIRKITSTGVVTTLAGSGVRGSADGVGVAASFKNPRGVAVDVSGNVYVADSENHTIRKITAAGVVSTLAGSGQRGSIDDVGAAASFDTPTGIAVDASGDIYVTDYHGNRIRKVTAVGVVSTLAGNGTQGSSDGMGTAASFSLPQGIAVDVAGNLYVAEAGNDNIRKIIAR